MDLSADRLLLGFLWYAVFLFSTTLHEAAHAWAALRLGDPTAYEGGQVTLNPWPHVRREPLGTILVPWLSFLLGSGNWMIGWASAPYDPGWAHRHPRRSAWMSLAGPAANLLLLVLAGLVIRGGFELGVFLAPETARFTILTEAADPAWNGLAVALSITFTLNLVLFLFNLVPVPPLDGSGALPLLLSEGTARRYLEALWSQPALSFLGLVVAWRLFGQVFEPIWVLALQALYPGLY
jgi:Zn-dependent protease